MRETMFLRDSVCSRYYESPKEGAACHYLAELVADLLTALHHVVRELSSVGQAVRERDIVDGVAAMTVWNTGVSTGSHYRVNPKAE